MAKQIIIALCEGPHDVSFICRILKSNGFVSNEKLKINEFPQPMDRLMAQEIIQTDVEELNLQEVRQNFLPTNTLQKEDNYVFLYSMGGDGKKQPRQHILRSLKLNVPEPGEITKERLPADTQLSLVYFFDADSKGVQARLAEVNAEVREVLTEIPENLFLQNAAYAINEGIKLGCYIFTGNDNNTGTLEDILVPLMQNGNDHIFNNANEYLHAHFDDARLFPLKLTSADGATTEARSIRSGEKYSFDVKKSLLGVVGQLQKSGKANTVCISDTDYLNLSKIINDPKCQAIIQFFNNFTNNN